MAVLRFFAGLFLLVAVIALVSDLTPWLGGNKPLAATSFAKHWADMAPATLKAAQAAVTRSLGAWVWDIFIATPIRLPTWLLFGLLASVCGWLGRRRRRVDVFVN